MKSRAWIVALAASFALTTALSPAFAQNGGAMESLSDEQKEEFLRYVQDGREAYNAGKFEEAIPFFKKAYEVAPKPELHYRIALSYENAGNAESAVEYYEKFLEARPETDKRGKIEASLERLKKQVAESTTALLRIESDPSDAKVYVGDASESEGTTPVEFRVEPGEVRLRLDKEGYSEINETVDVDAGSNYQFSYSLPSKGGTTSGGGNDSVATAALITGLIGAAGAVAGGTFYGIALNCTSSKDKCTRDLYNASVVGAWIGAGVGLAGLSTAGILILTNNSDDDQASNQLNVGIGPRSVSISGPLPRLRPK